MTPDILEGLNQRLDSITHKIDCLCKLIQDRDFNPTPTVGCPVCGDELVMMRGDDGTLSCYGCGYVEGCLDAELTPSQVEETSGPTAEQKNPQHYNCKGCGVGRDELHKDQCPLAHNLPDDEVRCPGCGNRPTMGHQAGCDAVTPRWSPP